MPKLGEIRSRWNVNCRICGGHTFIEAEYTTGDLRAPALECAECHAIHLTEEAAKSDEERDSVRRALAARRATATMAPPAESGSHQVEGLSIDEIDGACSHVELAVAQMRLCLAFLQEVVTGDEAGNAVAEARTTLERIHLAIEELGKRCARAARRSGTGGGAASA